MRLLNLFEGLSKLLFHITTINNAGNIARDDAFHLSMSMRTPHEENTGTKKRLFYMSASRLPNSQLQKLRASNYHGAVLFVLDGEKLSHNYSGEAVNYFHNLKMNSETEFEDRIYSDKPEIPNASRYIKEVHIYVPDSLDTVEHEDIQYLQSKFPTYIHYDKKSFLSVRHTKNDLFHDKSDLIKKKRQEPEELQHDHADSLVWWIDALYSPVEQWGDFSYALQSFIRDVEAYPEDILLRRLRAAANNAGNKPYRERFASLLRNYKLKTAEDVIEFLKDKWTNAHN